jgi:hypothetical protein
VNDPGTSCDHCAVVDVAVRYAVACDRRDWRLFEEVFLPDVRTQYTAEFQVDGRDAVVAMVRSMLGGCGPTQHLLGSHVVAIDGDRATASCQIRAWHRGVGDAAELTYEAIGSYHDELVRTPDGWRIAHRRMDVIAELGTRDVLGPG